MEHDLPTHLEHKPLVAVPYEAIDGLDAGKTDAKYISLGLSQWDARELSLKVFRYAEAKAGAGKKGKWSRQSEELPLWRPIDLVLLLALAISGRTSQIPAGTFWMQEAEISAEVRRPNAEIRTLMDFLEKQEDVVAFLKKRLLKLWEVLDGMKKAGII